MSGFYEDILVNLTEIPLVGAPGQLIIIDDPETPAQAEAVLTGPESSEDVFMACAEYEEGRVFVAAHECYYEWLGNTSDDPLKQQLMNNIKLWLTKGEKIDDRFIFDASLMCEDDITMNLKNFKIIKWFGSTQLSETLQQRLLDYLSSGGALFAAFTPWSYLDENKDLTLDDISLNTFLKNYMDIVFNDKRLKFSTNVLTENNQAQYSNIESAVAEVPDDPAKMDEIYDTLDAEDEEANDETNATGGNEISGKSLVVTEKENTIESILKKSSQTKLIVIPSGKKPVKASRDITQKLLDLYLKMPGLKAPNIGEFPGDYPSPPNLLQNVQLSINAKYRERLSTGYYLPAGVELIVKVKKGLSKFWKIRVGAHTDNLLKKAFYKRWPIVSITKALDKEVRMFSPFGGLIYFETTKQADLTVTLSNVVAAPYYDVKIPETTENWKENMKKPGLWAELAGKYVILTVPSKAVAKVANPSEILEFWDSIIASHHHLRGTSPNKRRRERIICDKQPSAGYMHSGYPIVTQLDIVDFKYDKCILDIKKMKKVGNWGLFHEIGHNLQRSQWNFDGCAEKTVNIFSMHAMEFIIGKKVIDQPWLRYHKKEITKYFKSQPTYAKWKKNHAMGLMTFAQLIKHFGWPAMHKFMSDYEDDISSRKRLPRTNQEKIDQWVIRYSKIVGRNIKPQFEMWGIPVSDAVLEHVNNFEPWCPVEEKTFEKFFARL